MPAFGGLAVWAMWVLFLAIEKGRVALGAVNSATLGEYRLISEYAVRGARPKDEVKISKQQARQTRVENSVTLPAGRPESLSARAFLLVVIGNSSCERSDERARLI
jgi:hypothetical protein